MTTDAAAPAAGASLPASSAVSEGLWAAVERRCAQVLEAFAATLVACEVVLLLSAVVARYVFDRPLTWGDEAASILFVWLAAAGAAIAMLRSEHLRLTVLVSRLSKRWRLRLETCMLGFGALFAFLLVWPAAAYVIGESIVTLPGMGVSATWKTSAMLAAAVLLTLACLLRLMAQTKSCDFWIGLACCAVIALALWQAQPALASLGKLNLVVFFILAVGLGVAGGLPIAFTFGLATIAYLATTTHVPMEVVVSRMEEGMSSLILLSVPIFVLLGCVLDATGMGKAIVEVLSALVGHVKAGMSYVLLGSLFVVSGISGSKVSDMATVAPALFPEMKRRGHKPREMVALLATGAAMADTVPPSIVLIVIGAVAGVSIAGLFQSGFVIAMVLLAALLILARWKSRHEDMSQARRTAASVVVRLLLIAAPALLLPFLIRGAVGGGVATATEVSAIAVLYAAVVGHLLYGGFTLKRMYGMLVETAALSGAILLILGTASAMAWAITQSGVVSNLSQWLTAMPGGWMGFIAVTVIVFVLLGCILEGLPAVVLLAPIMFPIARKLGIHDIHYAMVIVCSMNIGLMMPPIGVGFYLACRIGGAKPDEVMSAIWPYLAALLVGVAVIAAIPAISTVAL
ncbi:MAG: TRAP transporter large permease subunit [Ideonella sp.]|nr:TRAP transporter large permease subunit [Ideonella sp.]